MNRMVFTVSANTVPAHLATAIRKNDSTLTCLKAIGSEAIIRLIRGVVQAKTNPFLLPFRRGAETVFFYCPAKVVEPYVRDAYNTTFLTPPQVPLKPVSHETIRRLIIAQMGSSQPAVLHITNREEVIKVIQVVATLNSEETFHDYVLLRPSYFAQTNSDESINIITIITLTRLPPNLVEQLAKESLWDLPVKGGTHDSDRSQMGKKEGMES